MKNELKNINSEILIEGNPENVNRVLGTLYKSALEALYNSETDNLYELFIEIQDNFERIENNLNIEKAENKQLMNYGMLNTIVSLVLDINELKDQENNILSLFNSYRLLHPVLTVINDSRKISGKELKQSLNFNSDSNLSNFMSRIKKYNLIYIQKAGNTNYYSLTPKGKKTLMQFNANSDHKSEDIASYISETVLIELLDEIAKQLTKEEPSLFNFYSIFSRNKIELNNKNIIKLKINTIFSSRKEYNKSKFQTIKDEHKKLYFDDTYNNCFIPTGDYNDEFEEDETAFYNTIGEEAYV